MNCMVTIKRKASRLSGDEYSFITCLDNNFIPFMLKATDSQLFNFLLKQNEEFVKKGEIDLPLSITYNEFFDKDNKLVSYYSCQFQLANVLFDLKADPSYKRLLGYLLEQEVVK